MRKAFKAAGLALAAGFCLASCQTEEFDLILADEVGASVETRVREVTITADLVDDSPDTRTSSELVEGNKTRVYWSPGDQIKVFSAGESSVFTSQNTVPSRTAKFKGTVSMIFGDDGEGETDYIWGLYPNREDATYSEPDGSSATALITTTLPSVQRGKEDSFADGTFITIGRSAESLRIPFKGVCTGIYITFENDTDIDKVTLKGLDDEVLAGRFTAGMNEGADGSLTPYIESVLEPKFEVSLLAPDGGTFMKDKMYYIITLPVKFTRGFSLTVRKITGEVGSCSIAPANAPEFKMNAIGSVKKLDNRIDSWAYYYKIPDTVDLGLSVKWASFNLGATSPEDYGLYYAWGETKPKKSYTWENYKWCNGSHNTLTRYCTKSNYWGGDGIFDNKTEFSDYDYADDAARAILGGEWRTPTSTEWQELKENSTQSWTNDFNGTGVAGMIVTSNKEGYTDKWIFLPAAGCKEYDEIFRVGSWGRYWASTLRTNTSPSNAYKMTFLDGSFYMMSDQFYRNYGASIRPVK